MPIYELDLHGFTLDEALAEVDREVNHLFCEANGERCLRIVTGWGSVIRPKVQKFLQKHPLVKYISAEGASVRIILEDLD